MKNLTGNLIEFCAITKAAKSAISSATGKNDAETCLRQGWQKAFEGKKFQRLGGGDIRFSFSARNMASKELWFEVKLRQNDPKKGSGKNALPYFTYAVDAMDTEAREYASLHDFAYIAPDVYQQLKALALPEPWSFVDKDNGYEILSWYLNGTFLHLLDEGKILYGADGEGKIAAFCTGLVNRSFEDIYCVCVPNTNGKAEWRVDAFCPKGSRHAGKRLVRTFGNEMPKRATYYHNVTDVVYDGTLELVPDYDHLMHRLYRIELSSLRQLCFGSSEATEVIHRAEREKDPAKREQVLKDLTDTVMNDENLHRTIWRALSDACSLAQTRARYMFSSAIPAWNPQRGVGGKVFFCLPLSLVDVNRVDAVLVAARVEVQREGQVYAYYEGATLNSLQMAYKSARTLQRVDGMMGWIESAFPTLHRADEAGRAQERSAFSSSIAQEMTPAPVRPVVEEGAATRIAQLIPSDPVMGKYAVRPGDTIGIHRRSESPQPKIELPSIETFHYVSQKHGTFNWSGGAWSFTQHGTNGTEIFRADGSVQKLGPGSTATLFSGDELSFAGSAHMQFLA